MCTTATDQGSDCHKGPLNTGFLSHLPGFHHNVKAEKLQGTCSWGHVNPVQAVIRSNSFWAPLEDPLVASMRFYDLSCIMGLQYSTPLFKVLGTWFEAGICISEPAPRAFKHPVECSCSLHPLRRQSEELIAEEVWPSIKNVKWLSHQGQHPI
jgi:hypothetical protein